MAYTPPPLHDYQQYAKDFILTHPYCGLFLDMGFGKAVSDDTPLPTPDGWRLAGRTQVGDQVIDMHGEVQVVTAVYRHRNKVAYEVSLSDGRSFLCCDEHLVPVLTESGDVEPTMLKDLDGRVRQSAMDPSMAVRIPPSPRCEFRSRVPDQLKGRMKALGAIARLHGHAGNPDEMEDEYCFPPMSEERKQAWLDVVRDAFGPVSESHDVMSFGRGRLPGSPPIPGLTDLASLPDMFGYRTSYFWTGMRRLPSFVQFAGTQERLDFLCGFLLVDSPDGDADYVYHEKLPRDRYFLGQIAGIAWSLGLDCRLEALRPNQTRLTVRFRTPEPPAITSVRPSHVTDMSCFTVTGGTHTYLINDFIPTHNTLITLQALYELNPNGHVLVVAPKNIARSTWVDEIKKWRIPLRYRSLIVDRKGHPMSRAKRLALYGEILQAPPTVWFINRELLKDLIDNCPVVNGRRIWPFQVVVLDELQSFKNYKSQRFKALKSVMPAVGRLVGLTGTPVPNGLMDLWPQIYLMDGGRRLGKSITAYRTTFFRETLRINNYPVSWEPLPGAEAEIYRRIGDLVVSVKNPNIRLPKVRMNKINVYMDPDEMALYKRFLKESVLELDGTDVEAANSAVLKNKLSQMASGALYLEKGSVEYKVIHTKKLDICDYILASSSGSVLIAYHFQSDREMLKERYPDAKVFDGSPGMIKDWNERRIPVMLIQPASAGHGLNLQFGGHTLIWYTISPNLEEYLQTNARLARQGQPDPVVIHHLIAHKTVDVGNMAILEDKDASQERLKAAVEMAIGLLDEDEDDDADGGT